MLISRELEAALSLAVREATQRRHEFLTLEHVLFALLHDEDVIEVIRQCGGDPAVLKRDLVRFFDERFTTAAALRAVREMGGSTRGRKGDVDAVAATVLLQHALSLPR